MRGDAERCEKQYGYVCFHRLAQLKLISMAPGEPKAGRSEKRAPRRMNILNPALSVSLEAEPPSKTTASSTSFTSTGGPTALLPVTTSRIDDSTFSSSKVSTSSAATPPAWVLDSGPVILRTPPRPSLPARQRPPRCRVRPAGGLVDSRDLRPPFPSALCHLAGHRAFSPFPPALA